MEMKELGSLTVYDFCKIMDRGDSESEVIWSAFLRGYYKALKDNEKMNNRKKTISDTDISLIVWPFVYAYTYQIFLEGIENIQEIQEPKDKQEDCKQCANKRLKEKYLNFLRFIISDDNAFERLRNDDNDDKGSGYTLTDSGPNGALTYNQIINAIFDRPDKTSTVEFFDSDSKGKYLNKINEFTTKSLKDAWNDFKGWVKKEAPRPIEGKKESNKKVFYENYDNLLSQLWETKIKGDIGMGKNDIDIIIKDGIEKNKQVIFTGAPGTGKTYSVLNYVKDQCKKGNTPGGNTSGGDTTEGKTEEVDTSRYKFVQFHPSYDYSDFVEGLRPVILSQNGAPTFVRVDGIFKGFCRQIVEANLEKAFSDFSKLKDEDKSKKLESLYNSIKEKAMDDKPLEEKEKIFAWGNGGGVLDDNSMYYFIIDEINRADLSKVFGELMFGLEESYRGIENRFDTQYKNLKTYEINKEGIAEPMKFDCFENGFFIPHNLKIIGTMNDIDRSVESFDFALRRRFQWIDIKANDIMERSLHAMLNENVKKAIKHNMDDEAKTEEEKKEKKKKIFAELREEKRNIVEEEYKEAQGNDEKSEILAKAIIDDLAPKVIAMNVQLTNDAYGLSEAYYIGPAYFKSYCYKDGKDNLEEIYEQKIQPIIREYMRGRKNVAELEKKCKESLGIGTLEA